VDALPEEPDRDSFHAVYAGITRETVSMSEGSLPEQNADLRPKAEIWNADEIRRGLVRISHEIIESNRGTKDLVIVGIRRLGVPLAERIAKIIEEIEGVKVPLGTLDITLYRDDLSHGGYQQPVVQPTSLPFAIDDKVIVLVDDVLYTGRTVRAALDALIDYGRPKAIRLAVLLDRGHRELPIRADFVGKNVPTSHRENVKVQLMEEDGVDKVLIVEAAEE
jgi:pyrimidine operon attenuation protein/uracil phosphoribosyltransferase